MTISHFVTGDTGKQGLTGRGHMEEKINKAQAVVEIIEFGPLKITGKFILKDLKRNKEESPDEIWLCRCGKSNDKPYCDGSHKK